MQVRLLPRPQEAEPFLPKANRVPCGVSAALLWHGMMPLGCGRLFSLRNPCTDGGMISNF